VDIYDTGSADGTLALLERLKTDDKGAPLRVERGCWRDDFSWAREQSFSLVSPGIEWLLWLDADDELVGGDELRSLVASAAGLDAFAIYYDCARDASKQIIEQVWRVRLLRRSTGYRWQGAAHEGLVAPPGSRPRVQAVDRDRIHVIHRSLSTETDPRRNLRILLGAEERERNGGDALGSRSLLNLALEFVGLGEFAEAVPRFRRYLTESGRAWTDERVHACDQLAACLRLMGQIPEAIDIQRKAAVERPDWIESSLGLAGSYAALEQWGEAEEWAAKATALAVPSSPLRLDPRWLTLGPPLRLAEARLAHGVNGVLDAVEEARRRASLDPSLPATLEHVEASVAGADTDRALQLLRGALGKYDPHLRAVAASLQLAGRGRDGK
jgi:tetratricopeptide (TPR) repeat protein